MVRIKQRYLLVQILYPSSAIKTPKSEVPQSILSYAPTPTHITSSALLNLLRSQVSLLFGDYGSGVLASSLSIKYFSNATSTAIVRCPRAHYRLAWAALTFVTELPPQNKRGPSGENCVFRVVRVSGTIKKVEEEAVRRARRMIAAVQGKDGDARTLEAVFGAEVSQGVQEASMEDLDTSDED